MASFTNFVFRILLTISLILVTETAQERQAITSEEEKKELERQLKAINKPAIKSFKTEQGDIFDCIDIHKQLAFDHSLLKNHSVQLKPTTVPQWITSNNISGKADPLQSLRGAINCPDGTVIVKRTTMQDLMNAKRLRSMGFDGPRHFLTERNNTNVAGEYNVATVNFGPSSFSGVKGHINLWDPQVSQDQISLAFMAVAAGPNDHLDSLFVGWMVKPSLYQMSQDHARLYTYWGKDNDKFGCYDITCPGFVQVSKNIPLGALLQPISVYNGTQYEIQLSLFQDLAKGDWWFAYKNEHVGYWPASLFMDSGLDKSATYGSWGGQVYSPVTEMTPVMGSGHWPSEGLYKAAYVNSIKVIDYKGKVLDPAINRLKARETNSKCYRALYVHEGTKDPWLRALFYGGPAGCIGT